MVTAKFPGTIVIVRFWGLFKHTALAVLNRASAYFRVDGRVGGFVTSFGGLGSILRGHGVDG